MSMKEFVRKVTKTGDYTYYVTIPREFIEKLGWKRGYKVKVVLKDNEVVLSK